MSGELSVTFMWAPRELAVSSNSSLGTAMCWVFNGTQCTAQQYRNCRSHDLWAQEGVSVQMIRRITNRLSYLLFCDIFCPWLNALNGSLLFLRVHQIKALSILFLPQGLWPQLDVLFSCRPSAIKNTTYTNLTKQKKSLSPSLIVEIKAMVCFHSSCAFPGDTTAESYPDGYIVWY